MNETPFLLAGSANRALSEAIAGELGLPLAPALIERFPDGEVHVELRQDPRGCHAFLLQPTSPPPDQHLVELLALADACRRGNAAQVTAVVPYFGYARQDRRASGLESVTGRVVADCMAVSGIQRIVTLDLHTAAIEGFFTLPIEHLSAVSSLAEAIRVSMPEKGIIVSPDLGAAKLAERYGRLLELPVAIVHKTRLGPEQVTVSHVTGDVVNRVPIITDDMISTGGTIEAALGAVVEAGALREGTIVAATHGLFVGDCVNRLRGLGIKRLLVTDTIALPASLDLPIEPVGVASVLAASIRGLAAV